MYPNIFLRDILLGVVQGITEWLPISSEGQVVLIIHNLFGIQPQMALSIAIYLHLGTSLAVIVKYRHDFWKMIRGLTPRTAKLVVVSTLFGAVTGGPLFLVAKTVFIEGKSATVLIGCLLIVTGLLLKRSYETKGSRQVLSFWDAAFVGLCQGISVIPGVSRSGVTLSALLLRKIEGNYALWYSFIISVPAVLGVIIIDINQVSYLSYGSILILMVSSFLVGYLFIDILLMIVRRLNLSKLSILLGIITLGLTIPFIFMGTRYS